MERNLIVEDMRLVEEDDGEVVDSSRCVVEGMVGVVRRAEVGDRRRGCRGLERAGDSCLAVGRLKEVGGTGRRVGVGVGEGSCSAFSDSSLGVVSAVVVLGDLLAEAEAETLS